MKRALIVGAGPTGCVVARQLAEAGFQVTILEKRDHIAGNCYDYVNEKELLVPKYGIHIFHSDRKRVWEYLSRWTGWLPYKHKARAMVDGQAVPFPPNLDTYRVLDVKATKLKDGGDNFEEAAINAYGRSYYKIFFKGYTEKQWGMSAKKIPAFVFHRNPERGQFDTTEYYFDNKFQFVPSMGWTVMFSRMIAHPNIKVHLNSDDVDYPLFSYHNDIEIWTGPIDEYFSFDRGKLGYRSLRFEHINLDLQQFQSVGQVNYPDKNIPWTRIYEPKHWDATHGNFIKGTTIIKEFPMATGEPYYPIPTKKNMNILKKYLKRAGELEEEGIYFAGRLGKYQYINSDEAVEQALDLSEKIIERCKNED